MNDLALPRRRFVEMGDNLAAGVVAESGEHLMDRKKKTSQHALCLASHTGGFCRIRKLVLGATLAQTPRPPGRSPRSVALGCLNALCHIHFTIAFHLRAGNHRAAAFADEVREFRACLPVIHNACSRYFDSVLTAKFHR